MVPKKLFEKWMELILYIFKDVVVVMSGGARPGGISRTILELLILAGAMVGFMDRDPMGEDVARRVRARGGKCIFVRGDLRRKMDANRLVRETRKAFGPPRIVINTVGGSKRSGGLIPLKTTARHLLECYEDNVVTALNLTNAALPCLLQQSGDRSVVFISSINGLRGVAFFLEPAYSAAKSALNGLMRAYAFAYARDGVRFNCIAPGSVPNPFSETWNRRFEIDAVRERVRKVYPLGRWPRPEEVAMTTLLYASPLTSATTGAIIPVACGLPDLGFLEVVATGEWWVPIEEAMSEQKKAA